MLLNIGISMPPILLPTFLLFLSTLSLADNWTGVSDCGTYQVKGIGRSSKNGPIIVVNEKTQSEIIITLPIPNEAILAPYVDRSFVAIVQIDEMTSGPKMKGLIQEIKTRIPDPLTPNDTGIKMISKAKCK
jgi:hypothetical protein